MLSELRVRELGVIADLTLVFGPGMTALTGETGTGKTLVVEAIELLLGGRADPVLVRPGAAEASIEGRFSGPGGGDGRDGDDVVLARSLPSSGRSRGYVNGRMAPLSALEAAGAQLVDLHGQHTHQSLLSPAVQRGALDDFAGVDHGPALDARRRFLDARQALDRLGGDERTRARELDLLRFQVGEVDAARLADPEEDERLAAEEERLSAVTAHRDAAIAAVEALAGDGGATDRLGEVLALLHGRPPLAPLHDRLRAAAADVHDSASELRTLADTLEDDPRRLAEIRGRRQLLRELRRKYGDTLGDVMAFAGDARTRLAELASYEEQAARLDATRAGAEADLARAEATIGAARRAAAPRLAAAVEQQLRTLARPKARFEVAVGGDRAGDEVTWLLGANPGEPALPLAKVASGGELARTMLAVRLVLGGVTHRPEAEDPDVADSRTLVFDEVDAGIGGEAALAVGRALADLAAHHQVLVVTHLPQVAAFAGRQIAVSKDSAGDRTVATARPLDDGERVVELSRMLSGQPDSAIARRHAEELLALAHPGSAKKVRPLR